ncbi:exo-alpha-sialidase [Loktanella sp. IMCC34160]|uniref:sialidase family protein n=1 Tax=Loktanella sp. IMCC34160 TaxID=2510646 RepID=UPI00101C8355|nr:sialidase family protein [Loktanella sp. IMCC34160]RYG89524.1 exo-alpha-sialidase [Loktanella sp. IMCC34160]
MGDITILVGTTKGAFLIECGEDRSAFKVRGPFCGGWPINHVVGDAETGTIWAGGGGDWFGAGVWRSDDGGDTWTLSKMTKGQMDDWAANDPDFAQMIGWEPTEPPFGDEFSQVWSVGCAHGTVYAGTKPANLLASADNGATWARVDGLTDHPSRPDWHGGAAGLVLHTIVSDPTDPAKMWIGISAAGVFATEDGGKTWDRRNRLSNAEACQHHDHPAAPRDGETGHCVHNMVQAPGGDVLYQQNHHGVYRSSDGGRSWDDVTEGLPSTFGFPIAVHPRDPQTVWTLPLNGDTQGRFPPDAKAAVWKSSDGGQSWAAKRDGLPQEACFFTVLRQAMANDRAEPAGVYFGTNTGSVFVSPDEGETWIEAARHLPTVLSVEVPQRH